MSKVLIQYKRDNKGSLKGAVVSTGKGVVGWSLCHKNDVFKKDKAKEIAIARAGKVAYLLEEANEEALNRYESKIPDTIRELARNMLTRSLIYFKQDHQ